MNGKQLVAADAEQRFRDMVEQAGRRWALLSGERVERRLAFPAYLCHLQRLGVDDGALS